MVTDVLCFSPSTQVFSGNFTWEEAYYEVRLQLQATRAAKTKRYYEVHVGGLIRWAKTHDVPFAGFGKRHMDRYLIARSEAVCAPLTIHHDAVCAKAFFRWCQRNDIIERSLLADYEIRRAPRPARYMPTAAEMQSLLRGVACFWDPAKNPSIRYSPLAKRVFHRDRNYGIILGLLDLASRIGEMLSQKVDDYPAKERQIVIRKSKGREPRTLPVSPEWIDALDVWLRQRSKVLKGQEDEGWHDLKKFLGDIRGHRPVLSRPVIVSGANLNLHFRANVGQLSIDCTRIGEVKCARVQAVLR